MIVYHTHWLTGAGNPTWKRKSAPGPLAASGFASAMGVLLAAIAASMAAIRRSRAAAASALFASRCSNKSSVAVCKVVEALRKPAGASGRTGQAEASD